MVDEGGREKEGLCWCVWGEQLSVTTGAFETDGSLLSSFLRYQRSLDSLLLPYIRAFASHILYDLAALRTSVYVLYLRLLKS